ncbi:uncharacterized protein PAC_16609 [Phialocephala subalpina]|uniref:E3 ubiquitin-protein ligase listerin n=1 Tax=Phialocephala subalpina TaxID=576137 RepID=A0A1L7XNV7_9HELO|nr:uncharacterized protein PAC_16609 [Phialocephala subalpina]
MAGFGRNPSTKSRFTGGRGFGAASSTSRLSFSNPPPDLNQISDSNLIVSFKSLSKKNDTTLARALDDVLSFVKAQPEEKGGIEDAVIKAWSELYPRLSINNSRRVRELAHLIQHAILDSAKSRIQPYIPQMTPTWLAGTFDSDKGVSRAAQDGLDSLLNTIEKRNALLKKSQPTMLAYVQEGLDETPSTLSDERTMSADDLKAIYFRLIGNSLDMVTFLLKTLTEEDIKKYRDKYETLLRNEELLGFASSEDMHLRRSTLQLINVYIFRQPSSVKANLKVIGHALISDALVSAQLGSTYDLVETLKALTTKFPEVWIPSKPKKNPLARLRTFIEKGSQRGPAEYWNSLATLILVIPEDVFPSNVTTMLEVMSALRAGMNHRDEPKPNLPTAWSAYITIVSSFAKTRLSDAVESQLKLMQDAVFPAIKSFIVNDPRQMAWSVANADNIRETLKVCSTLKQVHTSEEASDQIQIALKEELKLCAEQLADRLLGPVTVGAQGYKVQDSISLGFTRWFSLLEWVWVDNDLRYLRSPFPEADALMSITQKLMDACAEALTGRQGKPYGAAAGMLACLRMGPFFTKNFRSILDYLADFLEAHLFGLIDTPSGEYLLNALKALKACPQPQPTYVKAVGPDTHADRAATIWSNTLKKVLALPSKDLQCSLVASMLLRTDGSQLAEMDQDLQVFVRNRTYDAVVSNDDPSWSVFDAAAGSKSISGEAASQITDIIANALISPRYDETERGLRALSSLSQKDIRLLISSDDRRLSLLTRLMELNEAESDLQDAAQRSTIIHLTKVLSDASTSNGPLSNPLIQIIQNQLKSILDAPLSVSTLVNLARNVYANIGEGGGRDLKAALFPTLDEWDEAFMPFYKQEPAVRLCAREPFAGALFLVNDIPPTPQILLKDNDGHSIPLRMALYTCEVMQTVMPHLPSKQVSEILFFLCLTQQLVGVQRYAGSPKLYQTSCNHIEGFEAQLQELLLTAISHSDYWRQGSGSGHEASLSDDSPVLESLVKTMMQQSSHSNFLGYYSGLALSSLFNKIVGVNGTKFRCSEEWLKTQDLLVKQPNRPFTTLAILTGFGPRLQSSELVKWFCNHLLAVVYGTDSGPLSESQTKETLLTMTLLNGCLGVYREESLPPHTARIAMSVKKILSWFDGGDLSDLGCGLASESCRALTKLLPAIKFSAGEHWQLTLTRLCLRPWDLQVLPTPEDANPSKQDMFVFTSSSIRMYSTLIKLKEAVDATDDVKEAFFMLQKSLDKSLLRLFILPRNVDEPSLKHFDEYLNPEILKIPIKDIDLEVIYPMLASLYPAVQATAFEVIMKGLNQITDDITINFAVNNQHAEFPAELLSLLLDSESMLPRLGSSDPHANPSDEDQFHTARRGVLLAWELIFSIIAWCPFQARVQLQEQLKELGQLDVLLEFIMFLFAGPSGKLRPLTNFHLDPSGIGAFDAWDLSHGLSRSVAWLTASVYHDALRFTPNLVRQWHINYTRAGKMFLGDWTEQNFTTLVVRDTIDEVGSWRGVGEVKEYEDGQQLIVRLPALRGNTIFVSYEIDDQMCSIALSFPAQYPIQPVEVTSVNRVAVPEKNWQAVIKAIRGYLQFGDGNLIDAIDMFRKNIGQYMEGHEQCSICYSIISEDMKVPEKKCATCKNSFHTKCIAKWFKTSNNNTCPMCRQNFTGVVTRR